MTASQVLLIGKRNEETVALKQQLTKNTGYEVELVSLAQRAIQRLSQGKVDLCVFNFDLFTKEKIKLATDLRAFGYDFPVLVLSRIIAQDAYEAIQNMHDTILLEKPFEQKDLTGLSEKLIKRHPVQQRFHRRFYTNQSTLVSPFAGGTPLEAKIFNLSRGGAYMETKAPELNVGDIVQLNVELREVYRRYNVNAKVIWKRSESIWGQGMGHGLEFIKAKDVYRDLLHKI